jgi:hypothetical protein
MYSSTVRAVMSQLALYFKQRKVIVSYLQRISRQLHHEVIEKNNKKKDIDCLGNQPLLLFLKKENVNINSLLTLNKFSNIV